MQPTQNPAIDRATTTDLVVDFDVPTPASTLRAAAGYLHQYGWCQGDLFTDPSQPTPEACLLGAVRMAVIGSAEIDAEHLRDDLLSAFNATVGVLAEHLVDVHDAPMVRMPWDGSDIKPLILFPGDLEQVVIRWNDHPDRNLAQVIAALHGAADGWDRVHTPPPVDGADRADGMSAAAVLGGAA